MGTKKRQDSLTLYILYFVTPEGFEPPTNGAEIRYSIQLNYGAL